MEKKNLLFLGRTTKGKRRIYKVPRLPGQRTDNQFPSCVGVDVVCAGDAVFV